MEWRRKSQLDEHYCAVHNVDCPLHSHRDDPMVLCINPMKVPTGWVCPQAVIELVDYIDDAEQYRDVNQPDSALFTFSEAWMENVAHDALRCAGKGDIARKMGTQGVESLSHDEIYELHLAVDEGSITDSAVLEELDEFEKSLR